MVILLGCACTPVATVRPGFVPEHIRTVGVLPFDGEVGPASVTADGIEEKLLECGVDVIDRSRIKSLLSERRTDEIDSVELGKLLGADMLVSGSVTTHRGGLVHGGSLRGVDTQDGRVQFSGQFGVGGMEAFQAGDEAGQMICTALARSPR